MKCQNPFFRCEGKSNRIEVEIMVEGRRCEICADCWTKIAESDIEWENKSEPLEPAPTKEVGLKLKKAHKFGGQISIAMNNK